MPKLIWDTVSKRQIPCHLFNPASPAHNLSDWAIPYNKKYKCGHYQ